MVAKLYFNCLVEVHLAKLLLQISNPAVRLSPHCFNSQISFYLCIFIKYVMKYHATMYFCFFLQVYEKRPAISGGEGTLISIFPNGCRALNEANPEIVAKVCFLYWLIWRFRAVS